MWARAHIFFRASVEMDVETLVRPVVESAGLELVEVAFGSESGSRVLRVTVDRDGGVDLETISTVSRQVSRALDLEGFSPGHPYALEVSSPGVERPLRTPLDFQRRLGEKVKVKTTEPATHRGAIAAADEENVTLATEAGELRIAYSDILSAKTVFEWGGKR
jgi:ribosome maturation factor RimP